MSELIEDRNKFSGLYEGFKFDNPEELNRVYSVGVAPYEAICAFAQARGIGSVEPNSLQPLDGGDKHYHWGYRFWAGGVSFKAAGQNVPGGVVLTWWK